MRVEVEAKVLYTCFLSQEDENKVKQYAEENECDYEKAVWDLYCASEISLYYNSTESDFSTEEVICVEE